MSISDRQAILAFLRSQQLATIATVGAHGQQPESALVAFVEDEQLNLYFQTGRHTRKVSNLKNNPCVALVIGFDLQTLTTVQFEGVAWQLMNSNDLDSCKQRFIAKKSPTSEEYLNHPSAIFFKIAPTWISFSDYSKILPHVIELRDFA